MKTRRLFVLGFLILAVAALAWLPLKSQFMQEKAAAAAALMAGRNVNMVSGTTLPDGDPWLQRQNEPSIAVSTRNPQHLLAGANDYRTVDMPTSEGELPGIEGIAAGDAWLGLFKSYDGGESWKTTLHPGFPQDLSTPGFNSGLKGYNVAADPVVRAGAAGAFLYSGIAFRRDSTASCVFVSRFVDNNNTESAVPIQYQGTTIVQSGNALQFVDKPWLAVDKPPAGSSVFNVYLAYSVFYGTAPTSGGAIMFVRSTDSGQTWPLPKDRITLVEAIGKDGVNQGATIAIDPQSGAVYVAWRNFDKKLKKASVYVVKSTNGGASFGKPVEVAKNLKTFDQATTGITFRTNAYPSMAVDKNGIVYLVWSERIRGDKGPACIMMTTSSNGSSWSKAWTVEAGAPGQQKGHQIMPTLTFASGKLVLAWYDQRDDASGKYTEYIDESYPVRRTVDVRVAVGTPGLTPKFEPSMQVSRYLFALRQDGSGNYIAQQVQFNPPDYPLFKGGTAPFLGDYVDVASSPAFVLKGGNWEFNTDLSETPVYHIAWTDNRDVRPPADNNWTNYMPPGSNQGDFGNHSLCNSTLVDRMGMRNQNIYTAKISKLEAGAVANYKTLGTMGNYHSSSGGGLIPRAFVLYVKNPSGVIKTFRLHVIPPPLNMAQATFVEFENIDSLDVEIAPFSSVARPLFVSSSSPNYSITVEVKEISGPGGSEVVGGLSTSIYLNPDPSNPIIPDDPSQLKVKETHTPNIMNPNIMNWVMVSPNIMNPNIMNPNIMNPNIMNPNIMNPNIMNPNIDNLNLKNSTIANPNIMNPNIMNPNIMNPNIMNPNIMNPDIMNATLPETAPVKDVTWRVKNEGNTATPFTFKMFSKEQMPAGFITQLLVYRVHKVPGILYAKDDKTGDVGLKDCALREEEQHELLLNVANPNIMNPNIMNPNIMNPNIMNPNIMNTTFSIPPGEEVLVVLRVLDPDAKSGTQRLMADGSVFNLGDFCDSVGAAATAHVVNTEDAKLGDKTPPAAATKLVIATTSLPDGIKDIYYSAKLEAAGGTPFYSVGGTPYYSWALNSGELPPGLILSSGGTISGTPSAAGFYHFNIEVTDTSSPVQTDTQRYSIYIDSDAAADLLTITTTSLPSGVKGYWYGTTLEATGGTWPRTWSLASGSLPPGLSLDSGGTISGTPTLSQTVPPFSFTVRVTDATTPIASSVTKSISLTISDSTGTFVTISGTVKANGSGLDGVVMRGLPGTPMTVLPDGYYEATVASGWSGTVEPFKVDYSFTPATWPYSSISANQTGQNYNAVAGTAAKLAFGVQPSNTVVNTTITPAVTVEIQDAAGNRITNATNTVNIVFNPQLGGISGTLSKDAVNGVATFNDLKIDTVGTGRTLSASSTGLTAATSNAFNITAIVVPAPEIWRSPTSLTFTAQEGGSNPAAQDLQIKNSGGGTLNYSLGESLSWLAVTPPTGTSSGETNTHQISVVIGGLTAGSYSGAIEISAPGASNTPQTVPVTLNVTAASALAEWVARYNFESANRNDVPAAMVVDGSGNVIVVGESQDSTEAASHDFLIIKYKNSGVKLWEQRYDGGGEDHAKSVAVDNEGRIYVTGDSRLLPGDISSGYDYLTISYDSGGTYRWHKRYSGPGYGNDYAKALAVDPAGTYVYVTGVIAGDEITGESYATIKYSGTDGSELWTFLDSTHAVRYNAGPGHSAEAVAIVADSAGNAYVTGNTNVNEIVTIKYLANGTQYWIMQHSSYGQVQAKALAFDYSGHLLVVGGVYASPSTEFDIVVLKYDCDDGDSVSPFPINFSDNDALSLAQVPYALVVDAADNIYVAGSTEVYYEEGVRKLNALTLKFNSGGVLQWARKYIGPSMNSAEALAVAVDGSGNVNAAGYDFVGEGDLGTPDFITVKYDAAGNERWERRYDGPVNGEDRAVAVGLDLAGNVFVTGFSDGGGVTGFDFCTIKYSPLGPPINTVAGTGTAGYNGDNIPATSAQLSYPRGIAVDADGNIYIADCSNNRIRKVDINGNITTYAGTGVSGFFGDGGPATNARLNGPYGIALDLNGNLFIADMGNHRIRKVDSTGMISTVAGNGTAGFSGDGVLATSAALNYPRGVAIDSYGSIYIGDSDNHRIRRVDSDDRNIHTFAGNGTAGFSGDGEPATSAALNNPRGVFADVAGNIFIADYLNNRIRKVNTSGRISTVAGNGSYDYAGNGGPALSASFQYPEGVLVDSAGNILIADTHNNQIRKVDHVTGLIFGIAGPGVGAGYSGDGGPAVNALLWWPMNIALDKKGNLFICEEQNKRIRKVGNN